LNSAQISTVFQRVGTERFGSKGSSFITEVRIVGGWSIASGYTSGHILEDTQHHLPLVETTIKRYQYLQELSPVTDPTRFAAMIHRDQAYDFGVFAVLTNKEFAAEVVQNTVIVPDYDFSPDERYGCLTYPDYHGLSIAYAAIKEPGQGELAESYNFTYFHSQVPNLTYSSGGGVVNDQGHLVGMQHDLAPDGSGLRFTPIPPDHETMRRAVMLELEEQLAGHG
jgi:hypothetical protein